MTPLLRTLLVQEKDRLENSATYGTSIKRPEIEALKEIRFLLQDKSNTPMQELMQFDESKY